MGKNLKAEKQNPWRTYTKNDCSGLKLTDLELNKCWNANHLMRVLPFCQYRRVWWQHCVLTLLCTTTSTVAGRLNPTSSGPFVRELLQRCKHYFRETWSWSNCKYVFQRNIRCNDHFQMSCSPYECECVRACVVAAEQLWNITSNLLYKWFAGLLSIEYCWLLSWWMTDKGMW